MRKCFIHIGTHKTGTTAIQHLLSRNNLALQERGYFYPEAGRVELLPGHHNLAWEISGDPRFQNHYGTIDDLIKEVDHRSEDIILSSEDLECSLHIGSNFSDFVSLLQSSGFVVTVILYVRNQIESLPRIYLTLMHSGMDLGFDDVLHPTLDRAAFSWRGWIFNFDYCDVLTRIGKLAKVDVVIRSYEQCRTTICGDFLSILSLTLRDLQVDDEIFVNASLSVRDYLAMFLQNRSGRILLDSEEEAINSLAMGANKIELSADVRLALFERFKDSNRNLFIQYGIPAPKMEDEVQDGSDTPYIDKLFNQNIEAYFSEPLEEPTIASQERS